MGSQRSAATELVGMMVACVASCSMSGAGGAIKALPLVRVGRKTYHERELLGTTRQELRAEFDEEVKRLSNEEVLRQLRRTGPLVDKAVKPGDRKQIEDLLFKRTYFLLAYGSVRDLIYATVCDSIVSQHQVALSELFDLGKLREGLDRQRAYFDFEYEQGKRDDVNEQEVYAKGKADFGLVMPLERWQVLWAAGRNRPAFMRWSRRRLTVVRDARALRVKGLLAHHLLSSACDVGGVFFQQAIQSVEEKRSTFWVLRIDGYVGDPGALEDLVRAVADPKGLIVPGGVEAMRRWFNDLGHVVTVKYELGAGMLLDERDRWVCGQILREGPKQYRMVGYYRKEVLDEKLLQTLHRTLRREGYRLAARRFLPDTEMVMDDLEIEISDLLNGLADRPRFWVKVDDYVKRPYPGKTFEDHGAEIQTAIAKAARLDLQRDTDDMRKYAEEMIQTVAKTQLRPVRIAFLRIAGKLAERSRDAQLLRRVREAEKRLGILRSN